MRRPRCRLSLLLTVILSLPLSAQETKPPAASGQPKGASSAARPNRNVAGAAIRAAALPQALAQGILEEEANLDLPAAISSYRTVIADYDEQRRYVANALFRMGECYRKLGQTNEAQVQYRRLLRDFADQTDFVRLAQPWAGVPAAGEPAGRVPRRLDPAQLKMLQEEITLVEQQLLAAQRKQENGKAGADEVMRAKSELLALQRQLPDNQETGKQVALIDQQVQLIQELLKEMEKRIRVGTAAPLDSIPLKRELLALQRERQSVVHPAEGVAGPAEAAGVDDEEAKEIRRIKVLIQNSPDLINATADRGGTPLDNAAESGQLTVARFLLANRADVEARDSTGRTALFLAAERGHKAMVELLVANGANVNAANRNGDTALMTASFNGFKEVVEALLAHQADLNLRSVSGTTALSEAARTGQTSIVQALLAAGAEVNVSSQTRETALSYAARGGFVPILKLLLSKGAEVNPKDQTAPTPLMSAVVGQSVEAAACLLQSQADVNARDPSGMTPLFQTVVNGQTGMVKLLLEQGAKPDLQATHNMSQQRTYHRPVRVTPLHLAAATGNQEIVTLLLEHGADPSLRSGDDITPLLYAVGRNHPEVASLLLAGGADPEAPGNWIEDTGQNLGRMKPLELAIRRQYLEMVKLLLTKGAEVNQGDADGNTPVHWAVYGDSPDILTALLARKPNLEARPTASNWDHFTPLQAAVGRNHVVTAKLLLDAGASPNAKADDGKTPLFWAVQSRGKEMVQVLLAHQAEVNLLDANGRMPLSYLPGPQAGGLVQPSPPGLRPMSRLNAPGMIGPRPVSAPAPIASGSDANVIDEIRELLLKAGANPNLERLSFIYFSRPSLNVWRAEFAKGSNDYNRFSLLEFIADAYLSGNPKSADLKFPDFEHARLERVNADGRGTSVTPVNLEAICQSSDCARDPWLQWGDAVVVPEADHPISENWSGNHPGPFFATIEKCLKRTVQVRIKGQANAITLLPFKKGTEGGSSVLYSFWLAEVVKGSGLLLTSSDTSRIKVNRLDPQTKASREYIINLDQSDPHTFWLRDGDVIEVPDRE